MGELTGAVATAVLEQLRRSNFCLVLFLFVAKFCSLTVSGFCLC